MSKYPFTESIISKHSLTMQGKYMSGAEKRKKTKWHEDAAQKSENKNEFKSLLGPKSLGFLENYPLLLRPVIGSA